LLIVVEEIVEELLERRALGPGLLGVLSVEPLSVWVVEILTTAS
jgi:hypothetical protein